MATNSSNGPTPRGNGPAAHADEVKKGAGSREVLAATADESPLAFDGTTVEKALQTTAKVSDLEGKDEGAQVSAEASQAKLDEAKRLDQAEDKSSDKPADKPSGENK
ncbi:hypothetical protein [Nonomuraea sp. NPDC050786]|uniref:hypothetical protein n=1 Tax=Nonomuraea sp. NPDC050786 TaxID=3154840 RepID=UPI0033C5BD92